MSEPENYPEANQDHEAEKALCGLDARRLKSLAFVKP
jgi:hypothetical protein